MILNNYWNLFAGISKITPTIRDNRVSDFSLRDFNNDPVLVTTAFYYSFGPADTMINNWNPRSWLSVRIGSGDTEPTVGDYKLATDITSSIADYNYELDTTSSGAKIKTLVIVSGTNNQSSAITIREIGVVKTVETADSGNSSQPKDILVVRYLLENPVTVQPYQGFDLTFEWVEQ